MNYKNIVTLLLLALTGSLFFTSCKDKQKTSEEITNQKTIEQDSTINSNFLIGSWKDQSESALHFSLYADGTAKSDNMQTLLYEKWQLKNNQIYLTAKSIGNGNSSINTEVYEIQKLDENQMLLKKDDIIFEYKKIEENTKTSSNQKSKIVSGKLTLGHEANEFKPCRSTNAFWVMDKTGKLKNLYSQFTKNKKAYAPIFVEIEIIDKGKAEDGYAAEYESTYEVINILEARELSNKDCK